MVISSEAAWQTERGKPCPDPGSHLWATWHFQRSAFPSKIGSNNNLWGYEGAMRHSMGSARHAGEVKLYFLSSQGVLGFPSFSRQCPHHIWKPSLAGERWRSSARRSAVWGNGRGQQGPRQLCHHEERRTGFKRLALEHGQLITVWSSSWAQCPVCVTDIMPTLWGGCDIS